MKKEPDIKIKAGKNCFYANLYLIYNKLNFLLSEADLFFLGDGASCWLKSSPEKSPSLQDFYLYSCVEAANIIAKYTNIEPSVIQNNSSSYISELINTILNKNFVIMTVDQTVLRYHPTYVYEIDNPRHGIIVYHYVPSIDTYLICDQFVMNSKGCITACTSQISGKDISSRSFGFMRFTPTREMQKFDINTVFRAAIGSLAQLANIEGEVHDSNILCGAQALRRCIANIQIYNMDQSCGQSEKNILVFIHTFKMRYIIIFEYLIDLLNEFMEYTHINCINLIERTTMLLKSWNQWIIHLLMIIYDNKQTRTFRLQEIGERHIKVQQQLLTDTIETLLKGVAMT